MEVFSVAMLFCETVFHILWVFWGIQRMSKPLEALIRVSSQHDKHRQWALNYLSKLKLIFICYLLPFATPSLEMVRTVKSGCVTKAPDFCTVFGGGFEWENVNIFDLKSIWEIFWAHFNAVSGFIADFWGSCADVFMIITATSLFDFAKRVHQEAKSIMMTVSNRNWNKNSDFMLSQLAILTKELSFYFQTMNKCASVICLCWFLLGVPWVPYRFVDNVPLISDNRTYPTVGIIYYWLSFIYYCVVLGFAAEAKAEVCNNLVK